MNPLDRVFLNLGQPPPAPERFRSDTEETSVSQRVEPLLHRAEGLRWPDLVDELVKLAAGRLHGVGKLLLESAARGSKRIALASCHPGEGRTTVALALGRWFAGQHRGRRLLLVDADVERADLSRRVGLTAGPGIRELVSDPAPACELVAVPVGLCVLGAGGLGRAAAPAEQAWDSLAEWLRSQFDLVLVDTGAALAEGFCLDEAGRLAEAVLWVRDPRRTSLSELCEAQRQLDLASLGVIENLVPQERVAPSSTERRHRLDAAEELHVHVNRLPGNGVAKDV